MLSLGLLRVNWYDRWMIRLSFYLCFVNDVIMFWVFLRYHYFYVFHAVFNWDFVDASYSTSHYILSLLVSSYYFFVFSIYILKIFLKFSCFLLLFLFLLLCSLGSLWHGQPLNTFPISQIHGTSRVMIHISNDTDNHLFTNGNHKETNIDNDNMRIIFNLNCHLSLISCYRTRDRSLLSKMTTLKKRSSFAENVALRIFAEQMTPTPETATGTNPIPTLREESVSNPCPGE